VSLALPEIAARIGIDDTLVHAVLVDEVERGRVARDEQGRYRLVVETFDPKTLAALLAIDESATPRCNANPPGRGNTFGWRASVTTCLPTPHDKRGRVMLTDSRGVDRSA
jgi:hypothetical protein